MSIEAAEDFVNKLIQQQQGKGLTTITQDEVISELAKIARFGEKESSRVKALDTLARHFSDNLKIGCDDTMKEITISFKKSHPEDEPKLLTDGDNH